MSSPTLTSELAANTVRSTYPDTYIGTTSARPSVEDHRHVDLDLVVGIGKAAHTEQGHPARLASRAREHGEAGIYPLEVHWSGIAGSWRTGLLPRWMLGAWPPLMLLGSWAGQSLIPLTFAGFLIASRAIIGRYIDTEQS